MENVEFDPVEYEARKEIRTFQDLLDYNIRYFKGDFKRSFMFPYQVLPDQSVDDLIRLHEKGIICTLDGQGMTVEKHKSGSIIYQREYSEGVLQDKDVDTFIAFIENHPHLYGFVHNMENSLVYTKEDPVDEHPEALTARFDPWETYSGVPSPEGWTIDGIWGMFSNFTDPTVFNDLHHFFIYDNRWCKYPTSPTLIQMMIKHTEMQGGKRKRQTRRRVRRVKKSRRHRRE
jgi:hypothetical protein